MHLPDALHPIVKALTSMPDPLAITCLLAALALPWILGLGQIAMTRHTWKFPTVTLVVLALIVAMVPLVDRMPSLLPALDRNRSLLVHGELWRALTALFVHRASLSGVVFNLVILLGIGAIAEQHFDRRRWIAVYLGAGILTEFLALAWEPEGGGNSIAVFGLAGALSLLPGNPESILQSVLRIGAFAAGAGLLIVHDIHGIGFWAGAVIAAVLGLQARSLAVQSLATRLPEME
jgi:rhomboid protease GluP